jgi:alkylation response protein AidB-like acyl-CoA dehydrogenase
MLSFDLTDEQQLLKDSVERFIERSYPFDKRRKNSKTDEGFSRENWKQFAELGWLAVGLPEDQGGFGGAREVAVLMEAFGRGLVTEPWLASVLLAGGTIARAGSVAQQEELLSALIAGESILAFAHGEPKSRYDIARVETTATKAGDGWSLSGHKAVVLNGDTADKLVVSARTSGMARDREGISLFIVDAGAMGVEVRGYPTNDGGRAAEIVFSGATGTLLGAEGKAYGVIEETVDRATAAVCAESLGLMSVLNDMTLEYSKTREQFGQTIGKFQALQHRMADMFVALEEARSLSDVYMADVDSDDLAERQRAVSALKVQCDKSARKVGQEAIQLHGGIAMTDDYQASHYFKRLSIIARQFGDVDWHLDRYAALTQ